MTFRKWQNGWQIESMREHLIYQHWLDWLFHIDFWFRNLGFSPASKNRVNSLWPTINFLSFSIFDMSIRWKIRYAEILPKLAGCSGSCTILNENLIYILSSSGKMIRFATCLICSNLRLFRWHIYMRNERYREKKTMKKGLARLGEYITFSFFSDL